MYKPKYFKAHELVDKKTHSSYGDMAIRLFDEKILLLLDKFREVYGESITINNHEWGGNFQYSGLRPLDCPIGARKSKHKEGIAFDLKAKDMDKLRSFIEDKSEFFQIARVENFEHTPTWCHVEFSDAIVTNTYYFNP